MFKPAPNNRLLKETGFFCTLGLTPGSGKAAAVVAIGNARERNAVREVEKAQKERRREEIRN